MKGFDGGVFELRTCITNNNPARFTNSVIGWPLRHRAADDFHNAAGGFAARERPHQTANKSIARSEGSDGWDCSIVVLYIDRLGSQTVRPQDIAVTPIPYSAQTASNGASLEIRDFAISA